MIADDRIYLIGVLNSFIDTSIQRLAHSGSMIHRYRLTAEEIREKTGRQRIHEAVLADVASFFRHANVEITYDSNFESFDITLDLDRCSLNQSQAVCLSTAMTTFRAGGD